MSMRTIYVDHDELIRIRVMGHPDGEKNEKGWQAEAVRPVQYLVYAKNRGLFISDPGISIYLQSLNAETERQIF